MCDHVNPYRPYFQVTVNSLSRGYRRESKDETWSTYQWLSNQRRLAIGSSNAVLQHHCVRCGRDFVTDLASNSSHAVLVSAISFDQLSDEVTKRWLNEPCPGKCLSSDNEDRTKIIAALRVSDIADLSLPAWEVRASNRSESARAPRREPVRRTTHRRA
jgi:hypothetical protein